MSWMDHDFLAKMEEQQIYQRAPNPCQFPEVPGNSKSYWIREYPIEFEEECSRLSLPEEVDVVIIGSGISGATVAYQLSKAKPDLRVAMVEARGICTGATGRNGGHLGRPEVYHIRDLAKLVGAEEAVRVRQFGQRNREMMIETVESLNGVAETDLRLDGTIVVFETAEERQDFLDDLEFAKKHGHNPECYLLDSTSEVLAKADINPSKAQHGAAFLENCGTIYPRKLVALLLRTARRTISNFTIHPYTPAYKIAFDVKKPTYHYTVTTNRGVIRARSVFHATNAYVSHLVPSLVGKDGVFGCKAHMLAVQPNRKSPKELRAGFGYKSFYHWILQRPQCGPYLYGLATAESLADYNDNITRADPDQIKEEMKKFLEDVFPHHFQNIGPKDLIYDWTGIQGFTQDAASIVGRADPNSPGEFVSVGFNGEGMGRCFAAATVATDALVNYLEGNEAWTPPSWFPKSYARNLASTGISGQANL